MKKRCGEQGPLRGFPVATRRSALDNGSAVIPDFEQDGLLRARMHNVGDRDSRAGEAKNAAISSIIQRIICGEYACYRGE
jgi:hypothetical protein